MSFAEVVSKKASQRDTIRNIKVNDRNDLQTIRQIQQDELAKSIKIAKCITRASDYITITCADAAEAAKLDEALMNKYAEKITIVPAQQQSPKFKITNLPDDVTEESIIVDRLFIVNTGKRTYANVILSTDLKNLKTILERGSILYGFRERYVFEQISTLDDSMFALLAIRPYSFGLHRESPMQAMWWGASPFRVQFRSSQMY